MVGTCGGYVPGSRVETKENALKGKINNKENRKWEIQMVAR